MFNKTTARMAAGLLLVGAALAGCAHKDTVVGTWTGTTKSAQGGTMQTTMQLTQDGKETMTAAASGGPMSITMSATGTYTVDDTNLSQNMTAFSMNGRSFPVPANGAKTEITPYKLDGNTLTLTPAKGSPVVLTRQAQ